MSELTRERLCELLNYDPETGLFAWRKFRSGGRVSLEAGTNIRGYRSIMIDGQWHRAHRLAWLYMFGRWPVRHIDHIDGDGSNNKIVNLREATGSQNEANKPLSSKNAVGIKGVCRVGNKFQASARVNGKVRYLGIFDTKEEAGAAYRAQVLDLYGEYVHPSVSGRGRPQT